MSNEEYASTLAGGLRRALSAPWRNGDSVAVPLVDLCGIIQFLDSQADNLRDAGRLDALDKIGRDWRVTIAGKEIGRGHIRSALDCAISQFQP